MKYKTFYQKDRSKEQKRGQEKEIESKTEEIKRILLKFVIYVAYNLRELVSF